MQIIKLMIEDAVSESVGLRAAAVSSLREWPEYTEVKLIDNEKAVRVVVSNSDDCRSMYVTEVQI